MQFRGAVLTVMAVAGVGTAAPGNAAKDPDSFGEAKAVAEDGDYARAANLFAAIAASYEIQYKDSDRPLFCARTEAEVEVYRKRIEEEGGTLVDWRFCGALFQQAFSYSELGRYDLAASTMRRVVQISPLATNYRIEFGYALGQSKHIDESIATYDSALAMARESYETENEAKALRGLGYMAIEQQRWDDAEAFYRASLEIEPDNQVANSELKFIAENRSAR